MVVLNLGYFPLYISYVWVILPLYCSQISICINIFVNAIYIFTVVSWFTSYNILLGCNLYWEYFHSYFPYIICYSIVAILVDLYQKKKINLPLFGLVITWIETHFFVPIFSIPHVFISINIIFCCFLPLQKLFTLNIQHSNEFTQHHLYTIFEQIFSFSCFVFSHTQIQCAALTTREGVLYSICQVERLSALV